MKPATILFILGAITHIGFAPPDAYGETALSAHNIMEKNFYTAKIKSLSTEGRMTLINDKGQTRERKNTALSKLQSNGIDSRILVKFSTPADIRGTGFLQIEHSDGEDDLWIYLPALKKSRRLVANNKKDSFVGSDFSYGDISLPKVDQYQHTLLRQEVLDQRPCYVIESVPVNDTIKANSGYSKKITWVRTDTFLEARVEYYDIAERLLKTQITNDHQQLKSNPPRWFAKYREMSHHQTGHKTILRFDKVTADVQTPDAFFTTRYIEQE